MDQLKIYEVGLSLIPGIGNVLAKQLISYCGSAKAVFEVSKHKLLKIPGIGQKTCVFIRDHDVTGAAEKIIQYCSKINVQILHYTDPQYPDRLKQLYDAPSIVYYKGNGNLNPAKSIAIVGTRQATVYGKSVVEELVSGLKNHNATIISGLAYGIDYQAHLAALKYGLPTVGVIAGGFDHLYPSHHTGTARNMLLNGGLIAEYDPSVKPEAHFFPERNRIIAGMADAVIVVEAAEKGGALITAEYANNYHREVFAVPGNLHSKYSEGCNNLIKKHKAHILTSVKDIEYLMNWNPGKIVSRKTVLNWDDFSIPERKIIEVFNRNGKELLIDDLSWKSQIPLNQLASHLLNLEFRGVVKSLPGKKFKFQY